MSYKVGDKVRMVETRPVVQDEEHWRVAELIERPE